jgi:hypothetical protein
MRTIRLTAYLLAFLSLLLLVSSAMAQETTGGIRGTVKDPSGAVIPGATVQLSSPALLASQKVETDGVGFYRFMNLPPGDYTIEVSATRFRKYVESSIRLSVGKLLTVDALLEVGPTTQAIEVTAAPVLVDTMQSKIAVNVTRDVIDEVPKGRSFTAMLAYAPGVRYEPLQTTGITTTFGVNSTPGFQVDGASDSENVYALEGLDTSGVYGGGVGMNVPLDFVQEVQIKSSGFEAEYGGALGGVVNIVTKQGANAWHGSGMFYYQSDSLTAVDRPSLRADPKVGAGVTGPPPQYFQPKADSWRMLDPGFELGGNIKKDKLWLYTSYLPTLYRASRTVNFAPSAGNLAKGFPSGPRTFPRVDTTHSATGRLDAAPASWVRLAFNWNYAYRRWMGDLPGQDSEFGLYEGTGDTFRFNTSSTTDARTYRADLGRVIPNSAYVTSAYFTISPKMLASVRFGYWYSDLQDRGKSSGIRYQWRNSVTATTEALDGSTYPVADQQNFGYQNMPDNAAQIFDKYARTALNADWSWSVRAGGTHTIKAGYAMNRLQSDTRYGYNPSRVLLDWDYDLPNAWDTMTILPQADVACAQIQAQNFASYGAVHPEWATAADAPCRGNYGLYVVRDYSEVGKAASYNHSLFVQDAWNLSGRVTLSLGVRMDKEYLPSFSKGADVLSTPIKFGFTDKVAPRLGVAVDVLGNGKLKVYGSWGMYYDIMKYSMPLGSFGGAWWKDCFYTLDDPDYTTIQPVISGGHSCTSSGSGTPGTLIEVPDWRITSNANSPSPAEIAPEVETVGGVASRIQKDIKPMRSRRMDIGSEYALRPNVGVEFRYTRNRLDYTIEDAALVAPEGEAYYIVNPGYGLTKYTSQFLFSNTPNCPTCPPMPKAVRNYDGFEARIMKRGGNWFANATYTYSRLWGNYAGLTSTEIGDAGGGRHDPNVSRYFDYTAETYDAYGHPAYGLLPTDRPHTFKFFGGYTLKWKGMASTFGATQLAYAGAPWTTEINVISSTPIHPEGIGAWVPMTADLDTGVISAGAVQKDHRGPAFTNTDFLFTHEFKLSKANEALRATFEVNISNLFNQKVILRYSTNPLYGGTVGFTDQEYANFFTQGVDYMTMINDQELTFDRTYGMGDYFTPGRYIRFKFKVSF